MKKLTFDAIEFFEQNYTANGILKDERLVELYGAFIDMRRLKGKPVKTKYGVMGHIRELEKARNPAAMLEYSTSREYQGLWEPPAECKTITDKLTEQMKQIYATKDGLGGKKAVRF